MLNYARGKLDLAAPLLLFVASLGFFAWRAHHGLRFSTFGDETMHFVGAQVLLAGGKLYRDFIELHGPLAYAIPQLWGYLFGWRAPTHARLIMVALTLGAGCAVAGSACLRGALERMTSFSIFIGLVTTLWLVQSLCLYDYQPVSGCLLLIGAALFTIPTWFGSMGGPSALVLAGMCFSLTPFVAFSYGPSALLLSASGVWAAVALRRARQLRFVALGMAAGTVLIVAWMLWFMDFRGYLVFHFIHAMIDFGPYLSFGAMPALRVLWLPVAAENLAELMGVVAGGGGLVLLGLAGAGRFGRIVPVLLGAAGVVAANGRGSNGFQNAAFIILAFGLASLGFARLARIAGVEKRPAAGVAFAGAMAMLIAGGEVVARQARSSPHGYLRRDLRNLAAGTLELSEANWAQQVRKAADPTEGILVVPFAPDIIIRSGRLPMARYVYYLPWDADYARHPWLGLTHDLCADVARNPPPVIYYNAWVVWGRYDPRQYMGCLLPILASHYTPMAGDKDFYVRNDRVYRLRR